MICKFGCIAVALAALAASGCSESNAHSRRAPLEDIPQRVSVRAGSASLGMAIGSVRSRAGVASFRITKVPITVGQFAQCIAAGVCAVPEADRGPCAEAVGLDGRTTSLIDAAPAPMTCVTTKQARAYCEWVGGRLPRVSEWLYAARGADVHRFAWGDSSPTCNTIARRTFFARRSAECCEKDCDASKTAATGTHPSGDSPAGLSDILLTRAELADEDSASPFPPCAKGAGACVVTGRIPGAIDFVASAPDALNGKEISAFGFRCAWDGE